MLKKLDPNVAPKASRSGGFGQLVGALIASAVVGGVLLSAFLPDVLGVTETYKQNSVGYVAQFLLLMPFALVFSLIVGALLVPICLIFRATRVESAIPCIGVAALIGVLVFLVIVVKSSSIEIELKHVAYQRLAIACAFFGLYAGVMAWILWVLWGRGNPESREPNSPAK